MKGNGPGIAVATMQHLGHTFIRILATTARRFAVAAHSPIILLQPNEVAIDNQHGQRVPELRHPCCL